MENIRVFRFDEIDSTNNYLKELNPKYNLDLVIAKSQSMGRGRRGNKWVSENGAALFSFLLEDNKNMESSEYIKLPLVLGIATLKGIKKYLTDNKNCELSKNISYKWTNDVYLYERKISGILIEKVNNFFVVGIGININNTILEELKNYATSLYEFTKIENDIEKIIFEAISQVEYYFNKFQKGKWSEILEEINSYNLLENREIEVHFNDKIKKGNSGNILVNGCLEFFTNEERMELSVGEVHLKI